MLGPAAGRCRLQHLAGAPYDRNADQGMPEEHRQSNRQSIWPLLAHARSLLPLLEIDF